MLHDPVARRMDQVKAVRVLDAFDLKSSHGLDHAPGVVLVLDSFVVEAPQSLVGRRVRVETPAGRTWNVSIDEVKEHVTTISLFIKNLTREKIPIGSFISLSK